MEEAFKSMAEPEIPNEALASMVHDQPILPTVAAFPASLPSGIGVKTKPSPPPYTFNPESVRFEDALSDTMFHVPKGGERHGDDRTLKTLAM